MKKLICTLLLCIYCINLLPAASAEAAKAVKFHDITFASDAEEIDVSGIEMTPEEIEAILPQFTNLQKVVMCGCGIANEAMAELNDKYEDIRFVWSVQIGNLTVRTDDTWFAPVTEDEYVWGDMCDDLKYCIDMECIDLGHMWLSHCEWAANMPKLKYLILADGGVSDLTPVSNCKELVWLEVFLTPVKDYSPLKECTSLVNLNISYTQGDPTTLAGLDQVTHLWWAGSYDRMFPTGETYTHYLNELLPNAEIHTEEISATGAGWRKLPNYFAMRDMIGMYYMET